MPRLTFPILADELTLEVLLSPNGKILSGLIAAGQPIPAPVWLTGDIDTGSTITCISGTVLHKMGLQPHGQTRTQTASGPVAVNLFKVSLSIPPAGKMPGPVWNHPDLVVMELSDPIPGVDVLIGLDILLQGRLLLDGPGRQFSLEF